VLRSTDKALYALWALFWALMISVAVQDNLRNPYIHWWQPLLWEGSSAFVATLWLVYQRHATRNWEVHLQEPLRWFGRHAVWLPVVAVTFIVAIYGIRHGVYALTSETYEHESWQYIFFYEPLTQMVLDYARSIGEPELVIERARALLRQPGDSLKHDDHMHVRIFCPASDIPYGCEDAGNLAVQTAKPPPRFAELSPEQRAVLTEPMPAMLALVGWSALR